MPSSLDEFSVLTSVRVVCRECLSLCELPHVVVRIDAFVGAGSIEKACFLGSLRLVKYAAKANGGMVHGAHYAARYGHVHILRWLSDLPADRCDWGVKILDNAAGFDQWPAAQWLHTHRRDGCTTFAMNLAASCGNFQMVKWLHDNRTEGCTTNAMDGAAQMGYLDVVKWLHTNRTEGCTTEAMTYAAYNGHLDVVQWLHDNRSEGCSEDVYKFVAGGANSSLSLKGNDFERKLSCSVLLFGRTALKLQALDVLGLAAEFGQLVDCQVTEQRDGHRCEK